MIQSHSIQNAIKSAESYGFSVDQISPPDKAARLQELKHIIARRDVPFPVSHETAEAYLGLAGQNVPFGVGSLTDLSVDLREYADAQDYEALGWQDHLSWADLIRSQQRQKLLYACKEYLEGEQKFQIRGTTIPDYYTLNARIYQQTGWQLATVSKIIPADVFFHCHSRKFFPVTTFMRPVGTDYLEEPDIGHDIAGHVATFTIPQVAWVMNQHGLANESIHRERESKLQSAQTDDERKAIKDEADELLLYAGRIYWFTVEFGLVLEQGELKAFGAGILSSPGETRFSVESGMPNRIIIDAGNDRDLLRIASTDYLISEFQKTYFVLKDFASLESLNASRIVETVKRASGRPHFTWRQIVSGDQVLHVGSNLTSNDECSARVAARNASIFRQGPDVRAEHKRILRDTATENTECSDED